MKRCAACAGDAEQADPRQLDLPEEWRLPDTPETREALRAERSRGINWLLAAVAFAVWASGVFNNETPLRP